MEIIRDNIINNYNYLRNISNKEIIPVLKANAYGFGATLIADILYNCGVRFFAVARYSEALEIINYKDFKNIKILIFESIRDISHMDNIKNIIFSANSLDDLKYFAERGIPSEQIHIKVDLGFARNGILDEELDNLKTYIDENTHNFGGIYSHIFSICGKDGNKLIKKFDEILNFLGKHRFYMIHLISSETFYQYKYDIATNIRIGQLLYGINESNYRDKNLKKIFSLKGKISGIKNIENNKYVGYELKEKLQNIDYKNIAIVKLGYGDGFLKANENSACLINNKEYIISLVSMDYTFINIDESVKIGDVVEFYYDTDKFYDEFNCKIYEFMTNINERIRRELI
ncbi:MAG: alanine racemase [Fusobacteriaceae bacterium]|jgi:alanine racemase|nr:alanine racemase [Fusobacteriaceae bacterium]